VGPGVHLQIHVTGRPAQTFFLMNRKQRFVALAFSLLTAAAVTAVVSRYWGASHEPTAFLVTFFGMLTALNTAHKSREATA